MSALDAGRIRAAELLLKFELLDGQAPGEVRALCRLTLELCGELEAERSARESIQKLHAEACKRLANQANAACEAMLADGPCLRSCALVTVLTAGTGG